MPRAHLLKARGSRAQNITYCKKELNYESNFPDSRHERALKSYASVTWKPWQLQIISLCASPSVTRTVNWFWEPTGGTGKTYLAKYLYLLHNGIVAGGKKADVFHQVAKWLELHEGSDPTLVLLDVPRTALGYISYGAVESLKDGFGFSGKYDGTVFYFTDCPHVIVFANEPPDPSKLSEDRWNIVPIHESDGEGGDPPSNPPALAPLRP